MWRGLLFALKPGVTPPVNSVTRPSSVIRAMWPGPPCSVNQRLPSGPATIDSDAAPVNPGVTPAFAISVKVPSGVTR